MTISLRKKTLLVVDDNALVQKALRRLAEGIGYNVATVASRAEAIDEIGRCRFDVALVDMRLVEGDQNNHDGLAIIKYLHDQGEDTRAYMLTGYGQLRDGIKAATAGAVAVIEKELDVAATELAITQALSSEMQRSSEHRRMRSPRAFCGNENASNWELFVTSIIKPIKGGTATVMHLLDELAETCDPLLERPEDNGVQKVTPSSLVGLFWSRGLGQSVVVALTGGDLMIPVPRLSSWPAELTIGATPLHVRSKENLTGAIFPAGGLPPTLFTIRRDYWE